ncbi:MAG TPA: hypothetical protein VKU19_28135 [Bryobacteraceae bacterium]|nr:hypothetical protein [Bryobacteraceae bacterium]
MLSHRLFYATVLAATSILFGGSAAAQPATNASLKGTYNVRYLGANVDSNNPADEAVSFSGQMTFDGNGGFTVTGQGVYAANANQSLSILSSGQYTVLPGAIFAMTNPFDSSGNTTLYGGIGNGVLTASSTDTVYTDIFVAIAVGASESVATLSGNYYLASLEFQSGEFGLTRNTFFTAAADGKGGFGNPSIQGTAINLNNVATTQTSTGVTYTLNANGTGTVTFPAPSGVSTAANQLLAGSKILYVSADGSFFVAGGQTAYDMILGVKALSGNVSTALSGLYFTSYLENYAAGSDADGLYGSQGSANEVNSITTEFAHQRTNWEFYGSYDFTTAGGFSLNGDGTAPSPGFAKYVVGANGNIVIGSGDDTNYQLALYIKAPVITGSGVFLNPQGIVNAANNIPFTAQVVPGEVVSLFGTGLSGVTMTAPTLPFPTTLGGVSVNLSWIDFNSGKTLTAQAPIYFVSPTEVSAVIPYNAPADGSYLNFTVSNGGTNSNVATVYSGATQPGIFTVPAGGIGNGAILHADFSLVTTANPAKVGETVQIYLTGLGPVSPAVNAGAAAPSNPLSTVIDTADLGVYVDGVQANFTFAGLAPTLGGLYQLNVTIPSGVTLGQSVGLEILTLDADNIQATIPIHQ